MNLPDKLQRAEGRKQRQEQKPEPTPNPLALAEGEFASRYVRAGEVLERAIGAAVARGGGGVFVVKGEMLEGRGSDIPRYSDTQLLNRLAEAVSQQRGYHAEARVHTMWVPGTTFTRTRLGILVRWD